MNNPSSAKDFDSGQTVRWCPGCGDYAVLKALRLALADIGATPCRTALVSGIGCAARLPYYVNAYGFHTVHGRAPTIATGLKMARPDLDVWVITGDGDGMSIGAGHLHHILRRDPDLQILLFNNRIYGLTKGQASPTSPAGLRTASTPRGAADDTSDPCRFAMGSGARFVARELDVAQGELRKLLAEAREFPGAAFVEILQNCPIYHDGAHARLRGRETGSQRTLRVRHGEPLLFGPDSTFGIALRPGTLRPEVRRVNPDDPEQTAVLLRHDETDPMIGALLASLEGPEFPAALGVLHRRPNLTRKPPGRSRPAPQANRIEELHALLRGNRTWRVD